MKMGHKRMAASKRLNEGIVKVFDELLMMHSTDCLVERSQLILSAARVLEVTRQALYPRIRQAVRDGGLIEIVAQSDWRVEIPGGEDLPTLYVTPDPGSVNGEYMLQYNRPTETYAKLSFLTSPAALKVLLPQVRKNLGLPATELAWGVYYNPSNVHMVRPAMYHAALKALVAAHDEKLSASRAEEILVEVFAALNLRAPLIK